MIDKILSKLEDKINWHLEECKKYQHHEAAYHRHFWSAVGLQEAKAAIYLIVKQ